MFSIADCFILPVIHLITKYLFSLSANASQPTAVSVEVDEQEEDDDEDDREIQADTTSNNIALKRNFSFERLCGPV